MTKTRRSRLFYAWIDVDDVHSDIQFEVHAGKPELPDRDPMPGESPCALYGSTKGIPEYIEDQSRDWDDAIDVLNGDMTREQFRQKWGK